MSTYNVTKQGSSRLKVIFIVLLAVMFMVLGSVVIARGVYVNQLQPVSGSQRIRPVTIETGSSAKEIAALLEKAGLVRSAWAFDWYVRSNDLRDKLQAGTYYLRPSQGAVEIATILTQGNVAADLFTVLPSQRLDQIKSALIRSGYSETEINAALDPARYHDHPALAEKPREASLEGYLYPESFHRTATTTPETLVRQSLNEMQKRLTPQLRAAIKRQGLTVHEGVKLASIIEQEVSDPEDRRKVAQVFLRRLKEDTALESDPTAFYGAVKDGIDLPSDPAKAAAAAIAHNSPHNTYKHKGLPPTPISNVSQTALEAVANPAETDFLFFVSGDDGKTHFSRTLSEHQALTERYCKTLCG